MKPILFNTEMVKAILDGRKTVTRRVIKPQPSQNTLIGYCQDENIFGWSISKECVLITDSRTPPYQVGEVLYVRETFACEGSDEKDESHPFEVEWYNDDYATGEDHRFYGYVYKADTPNAKYPSGYPDDFEGAPTWKPSIHMPKEAARIFLKVTGVRVEQLQDITEEQAMKEGVGDPYDYQSDEWYEQNGLCGNYFKDAFYGLWDSLLPPNKNRFKCPENERKTNPWVWVIEFERCDKPEETNHDA
ncbi:MAG TPA: hypothetical protein DCQ90_06535 [Erysipelotrichaceae bacterium]|nr:hypothetical protein [Erysipelotrichaceae bacterium]